MPSKDARNRSSSFENRVKREDAIRELARSQAEISMRDAHSPGETVAPMPSITPTRRLNAMARGQRIALISSTLLLVIGIGVVVKLFNFAPQVTSATSVITIPFGQGAIQCAQGIAWSPDSRYLALLGYAPSPDGCPSSAVSAFSYTAGVIAVYDAQAGRLRTQYQPNTIIQRQLKLSAPPRGVIQPIQSSSDVSDQVISYEGIAWSSTSSELALPFHILDIIVSESRRKYDTRHICGLLLLPLNQRAPSVLSQIAPSGQQCSGAWDIRNGQYLPQSGAMPDAPVPWGISSGLSVAASEYQWNGGNLTPASILPTGGKIAPQAPSQITPVGAPDGQQSFSIWQPGTLESLTQYL